MTVEITAPAAIGDHFIPELFFDYLFIQEGTVECIDQVRGERFSLSRQSLKTIHTHPLTFMYTTPLVLYGARLLLPFAETYWGKMQANRFLDETWAGSEAGGLDEFKSRVEEHLQRHRTRKLPYPMLSGGLEETGWLVHYSPRHKRRLYKELYGLSRRELQNVRNVQAFLEQTCDFGEQNPHIIQHVNPDVFHDQPHLNHSFKKTTGLSPVEYFEKSSILQDNLMSASYNAVPGL
ncbi:MAG TPA: hypothetical protein VFY26_17485 [Anaerolineales bacterium]|nr:hypothetical protein [Anaerolineales bacterium]